MKKTYTKPEISFESFVMSTNIAGDCGTITKLPASDVLGCGYETKKGDMIFTSQYACKTTEDDGEYNGICYHVPVEAEKLFNS